MNKVILIGRLTREPDIRFTNGAEPMTIARYTLAVDRRIRKEGEVSADFISCIAFGKNAEFAEKYLSKGVKIAIEGKIQTGSYVKQDGTRVFTTDVVIESQEFCESKGAAGQQENNAGRTAPSTDSGDEFMQIPDGVEDDGLPF